MFDFVNADSIATLNSMTPNDILESLTIKQVKEFLESLGVNVEEHSDKLICPTICHNILEDAHTMKLYYYNNNKSFHCYTECNENFSLYELYRRFMELNEYEITFSEAVDRVKAFIDKKKILLQTKHKSAPLPIILSTPFFTDILLDEYDERVISRYPPYHHADWLNEGITDETMDLFEIGYALLDDRIIIPHRDRFGRLVGIRRRALDSEEAANFGKYRPLKCGNIEYSHQLSFNLYGIWQHQDAIRQMKRAVIYEGEKSTMRDHSYFGNDSIAVATCGSHLNKFQIGILVQHLGVNEIIIAYDKEYDIHTSEEAKTYRKKLVDICDKYKPFVNMSYLFDEKNLLKKKDAPIDKGKEVFEELYNKRIKVM